tara:strand:+ start:4901 stop:5617 length:717 start_codon:yes stop_codon:yes gene_type:complete
MAEPITNISLIQLSIIFIPVCLVIRLLYSWSLDWKNAIYAMARMLLQLLLIGYCLTYIFESENAIVTIGILTIMIFAASWIALRIIPLKRHSIYQYVFISIFVGGSLTLMLVTQFVLNLNPWFLPEYMIPLAGMIFASSMNGVSLAAERLHSEIDRGGTYFSSRGIALRTALIPITNSLFAVGLVSLPGMMTGQIISGVSPLIAVRYQIMVMCMLYSAVGISTALFLYLIKSQIKAEQ